MRQILSYCFGAISSHEISVCAIFYAFSNCVASWLWQKQNMMVMLRSLLSEPPHDGSPPYKEQIACLVTPTFDDGVSYC